MSTRKLLVCQDNSAYLAFTAHACAPELYDSTQDGHVQMQLRLDNYTLTMAVLVSRSNLMQARFCLRQKAAK